MAKKKLSTNYQEFLRMLRVVEKAVKEEKGFFHGNWRREFLPQWNLPLALEFDPQRREVADEKEASRWIFTRVSLDRLSLSGRLGELVKDAWEDEDTRWLFDPAEVRTREVRDVEYALKTCFNHALPVTPGMSAGEGYWNNANVLVDRYDGDVRNVLDGGTVSRGIGRLRALDGWGPGLSRLLMVELHDRRIVSPTNVEKLENKVDRHKAGIPLNTECTVVNGDNVNMWGIARHLQGYYSLAFSALELPPEDIDAAMWVVGSKGCARQSMYHCNTYCPLAPAASGLCVRASSLGHNSGAFILMEDGKKVDRRRPNAQIPLDFTGVQRLDYEV